jgi:hypothetical protein
MVRSTRPLPSSLTRSRSDRVLTPPASKTRSRIIRFASRHPLCGGACSRRACVCHRDRTAIAQKLDQVLQDPTALALVLDSVNQELVTACRQLPKCLCVDLHVGVLLPFIGYYKVRPVCTPRLSPARQIEDEAFPADHSHKLREARPVDSSVGEHVRSYDNMARSCVEPTFRRLRSDSSAHLQSAWERRKGRTRCLVVSWSKHDHVPST